MKDKLASLYQKRWFEKAFGVTVAIKGLDGLIELVAGVALLISPGLVHWFLGGLGSWLGDRHVHVLQFIGDNIARVDSEFTRSGLVILIIFLISHGIVKLALVYCLLKKIVRAYPYAMGVLGLFLVYQIYVLIVHPTIGMAFFALLDIVIIVLVYGEYRKLQSESATNHR